MGSMRAEPKIVPGARRRQRRAKVRHRDLAVGIVACLQTHGSRANWHPHLHLLVTDGGFRPDGTFVSWSAQDTARLTEAFRRAVLRLFVRRARSTDLATSLSPNATTAYHRHLPAPP